MTKEILNANRERLGKIARGVATLPAFAFADIPQQITTTTSLLILEPWEIAVAKGISSVAITGYYLMTLGSQLHANEGRTRFQKRVVNLGLAMGAPAVAFMDYLILIRAPF